MLGNYNPWINNKSNVNSSTREPETYPICQVAISVQSPLQTQFLQKTLIGAG